MTGVNAGLINDRTIILQGPSSKTTLTGPDGSRISVHAPGGRIVHSVQSGYIAHTGHEEHVAEIIAPTTMKSTNVVTPVVFNHAAYNFADEYYDDDENEEKVDDEEQYVEDTNDDSYEADIYDDHQH